jgi:hypothetical protein
MTIWCVRFEDWALRIDGRAVATHVLSGYEMKKRTHGYAPFLFFCRTGLLRDRFRKEPCPFFRFVDPVLDKAG